MEFDNEDIHDLLESSTPLIRQDWSSVRKVRVQNESEFLQYVFLKTIHLLSAHVPPKAATFRVLAEGAEIRELFSGSHGIFSVLLKQQTPVQEECLVSRLQFVDLAAPEGVRISDHERT